MKTFRRCILFFVTTFVALVGHVNLTLDPMRIVAGVDNPLWANMPGTFQPILLASSGLGPLLNCSGGTISVTTTKRIHVFNSNSSLVCTGSGSASYAVIAG